VGRATMPSLFVYTLTFDTGFAPHVDREGRFLTLATCKPDLRRVAQKDDWILGVGGVALKGKHYGEVIFLAKLTEPPMSFDGYHRDERFRGRLDNIYARRRGRLARVGRSGFHQSREEMEHDWKTDRVLVSAKFAYFGPRGPDLEIEGFTEFVRPIRRYLRRQLGRLEARLILQAEDSWSPWNEWQAPSTPLEYCSPYVRTHGRSKPRT